MVSEDVRPERVTPVLAVQSIYCNVGSGSAVNVAPVIWICARPAVMSNAPEFPALMVMIPPCRRPVARLDAYIAPLTPYKVSGELIVNVFPLCDILIKLPADIPTIPVIPLTDVTILFWSCKVTTPSTALPINIFLSVTFTASSPADNPEGVAFCVNEFFVISFAIF